MVMLLQVLIALTAKANAHAILHWEPSIPLSQKTTLEVIEDKASILQHQDDDTGVICGGETDGFQLADYFTFEDFDGNVTHMLKVQFLATVPVNYCENEDLNICEITFTVDSADQYHVSAMICSDFNS